MNARRQHFQLNLERRQIDEAVSSIIHTLLLHRSVGKFSYQGDKNYSIGIIGTEDVDCNFIDLTYVRVNCVDLWEWVAREVSKFGAGLAESRLIGDTGSGSGDHHGDHHHSDDYSNDIIPSTSAGGGHHRRRPSHAADPFANNSAHSTATLSIEFYQRRPRKFLIPEEEVPWEIWNLQCNVFQLHNENEYENYRENVGETIGDVIFEICNLINRNHFIPKMPVKAELGNIFDTSYSTVQPYLFKIKSDRPGGMHKHSSSPPSYPYALSPGQGLGDTFKKLIKDTLSS